MSNTATIARPYAKAIFEHALAAKKLSQWSEILCKLALVMQDELAKQFIANPAVTVEQQIQLLMVPCEKVDPAERVAVERFVTLLAQNKRLKLLPDIQTTFEILRAEQEKTLQINIISFSEFSTAQATKLVEALSQRLQCNVEPDFKIDKSLLGGAIIRAGDLVIDGSVRGRLDKLSADLAV